MPNNEHSNNEHKESVTATHAKRENMQEWSPIDWLMDAYQDSFDRDPEYSGSAWCLYNSRKDKIEQSLKELEEARRILVILRKYMRIRQYYTLREDQRVHELTLFQLKNTGVSQEDYRAIIRYFNNTTGKKEEK